VQAILTTECTADGRSLPAAHPQATIVRRRDTRDSSTTTGIFEDPNLDSRLVYRYLMQVHLSLVGLL